MLSSMVNVLLCVSDVVTFKSVDVAGVELGTVVSDVPLAADDTLLVVVSVLEVLTNEVVVQVDAEEVCSVVEDAAIEAVVEVLLKKPVTVVEIVSLVDSTIVEEVVSIMLDDGGATLVEVLSDSEVEDEADSVSDVLTLGVGEDTVVASLEEDNMLLCDVDDSVDDPGVAFETEVEEETAIGAVNVGMGVLVCETRSIHAWPATAPMTT